MSLEQIQKCVNLKIFSIAYLFILLLNLEIASHNL